MSTARPPTHVLVVEPDDDLRDTLTTILDDVGYVVTSVATVDDAYAQVDAATFDLILSAALAERRDDRLDHAEALRVRAHPTPVGVLTGWTLSDEEMAGHDFAFILPKPFDLDKLVARIAAALDAPLSDEQRRQTEVVRRYFAALAARDWDGFIALCADDVRYELPGEGRFSTEISGTPALRAYTEEIYRPFAEVAFTDLRLFGLPDGLAARFVGGWTAPDGSRQSLAGAVVFQFVGERIRQIGVRLNAGHLDALTAEQDARTGGTPGEPSGVAQV